MLTRFQEQIEKMKKEVELFEQFGTQSLSEFTVHLPKLYELFKKYDTHIEDYNNHMVERCLFDKTTIIFRMWPKVNVKHLTERKHENLAKALKEIDRRFWLSGYTLNFTITKTQE